MSFWKSTVSCFQDSLWRDRSHCESQPLFHQFLPKQFSSLREPTCGDLSWLSPLPAACAHPMASLQALVELTSCFPGPAPMLAHHTHHPHLPSASAHTLSLHVFPLLAFWWAHLDDHIGLINLAVDFMGLHPRHVDIFVFSRSMCSFVDILGHTRHWPSGLSQPTFSQVHPLATHQWEWEPQVIPHHWSLPPLSNARLMGCPAFPWWGPQLQPQSVLKVTTAVLAFWNLFL